MIVSVSSAALTLPSISAVWRPCLLVILQKDKLVFLRQSALGRIGRSDICLIIFYNTVLEAVVIDLRGLELKRSVYLLQTRQSILALIKLALRGKAQFIRVCLQIANGQNPIFIGSCLADEQALPVIGLCVVQPCQGELLFVRLLDGIIP